MGLLVGWLADQWLPPDHWLARLDMVMVALIIAGVYGAYALGGLVRSQAISRRILELLNHMDADELKALDVDRLFVDLPPGNPWVDVITQFRGHLLSLNERRDEAELNQASLEVRSRRHAKQQRQISDILESLSDPILVVDDYDELILANASACELFDLQLESDEKQLLADLIECENITRMLTETRRHNTHGERACEVELKHKDGQSRWYRATAKVLNSRTDEANDLRSDGIVTVLRDISSHKEIQKRNAEFVSSASHEMKTPLSGIKAYVELLQDGDAEDEETRQEFLDIISMQADRLQRLVESLLNIARIEAGVVKVSKAQQSLNEILEEAFGVIQPVAVEKDIQLKKELSEMFLGVHVDRDMILQAAINLLSNAVKYTPEGGSVVLRSRMAANRVELEVEDAGVGLSEEDQEKVFEKFYRVRKDKTMASGTGLGLPLVKHIVEDVHQGSIHVESELGKGSIFTVRLPVAAKMK